MNSNTAVTSSRSTAMGRFYNYSFGNILEVARQRPDANRVAGLHVWNQLGRKVLVGFRSVYVFDVSQTEGEGGRRWHPGLYLCIPNPPYLQLVIEAMDESGPCGLPALSICHYGDQDGTGQL